jgi:hypothetical protein
LARRNSPPLVLHHFQRYEPHLVNAWFSAVSPTREAM